MMLILFWIMATRLSFLNAHSVFSPLNKGERTDPNLVMHCVVNCTVLDTCVAVNISYTDPACRYLDKDEYKWVVTHDHSSYIYRRSKPNVCYNGGRWSDSTKRSCECDGSFTGEHCEHYWKDCSEGFELGHSNDGVYTIQPRLSPSPFEVYCVLKWGGRTYIQLQKTGLDFNRGWQEYRDGFGSVSGDHWLGLQRIHEICISKTCRIQFHITLPCCPTWKQCYYDNFRLTDESDGYRFLFSYWSIGTTPSENQLPDALVAINGMKFSTFDRDHDENPASCAQTHQAGWWFNNCTLCNPNGKLKPVPKITREPWHVSWESGDDRGIEMTYIALRTYN